MDEGDGSGVYVYGEGIRMCMIPFRHLKVKLGAAADVFCISQVVANLMNYVIPALWFLLYGLFETNLATRCSIISNLWINDC